MKVNNQLFQLEKNGHGMLFLCFCFSLFTIYPFERNSQFVYCHVSLCIDYWLQ